MCLELDAAAELFALVSSPFTSVAVALLAAVPLQFYGIAIVVTETETETVTVANARSSTSSLLIGNVNASGFTITQTKTTCKFTDNT